MDTHFKLEHDTLVNEITRGMEMTSQLKFHMNSSTHSLETQEMLLQKILSSYDNALLMLSWGGSSVAQSPPQAAVTETSVLPESPISVEGSPRNDQQREHIYESKKRKALPTWKDKVRICSDNGIEDSSDDGFSWRKYGQKDILGAKYPRSYYRCTYRNTQTCSATKQVQRSNDDSALFEIRYKGKHTCSQDSNAFVPSASPENQEKNHKNRYDNHQQQQQPDENLLNLRANLRVKTDDLDKKEISGPFSFPSAFGCQTNEGQLSFPTPVNDSLTGSFSPFTSPATSSSSYFSISPYQMNTFGHVSESNHTEILPVNTATTNSPIADLDFSLDQVGLDPNFPFNTLGFFL